MNIQFIPEAVSAYKLLDRNTKKQINETIDKLKESPFIGEALGNKNNIDLTGYHKIYSGGKTYRIIYLIMKNEDEIEIWDIEKVTKEHL